MIFGLRSTMICILLIAAGLPSLGPQVGAMPPETIIIHYDRMVFSADTGLHMAEVTRPADCTTQAPGGTIVNIGPALDHVEFPGTEPPEITVVCPGADRCEDIEVLVKNGFDNSEITGDSTCGARMAGPVVVPNRNVAGVGAQSAGFATGDWKCRAEVTGGSHPHWYDVKCMNTPHPPQDIKINHPAGAGVPVTVTHPDGCTTTAIGGVVNPLTATTDQVSGAPTIIEVTCNGSDVCKDATVTARTYATPTSVKGETKCGTRSAEGTAFNAGGLATATTQGASDAPWICRATILAGGASAAYDVDCSTS